jgi:hypothetical protein
MKRAALLLVVLLGCAQDGEDGEDGDSVEIEPIANGSTCPAGGVRVSVGETSQVVCNGERGATGSGGPQGSDGHGIALVPETIAACNSVATLPASGLLAVLAYKAVTFSEGSVLVSCSAQTNGVSSAGYSELYAGWQQGSLTGSCIVGSDGSGAVNGGWWQFTMGNGRPGATYHDMGSADDLWEFTFPLSDCPTATRPN